MGALLRSSPMSRSKTSSDIPDTELLACRPWPLTTPPSRRAPSPSPSPTSRARRGLLQELGDRYPEVLADHHRLIREAFARHGAVERGSAGDGLYFVFSAARDAVQAAIEGQLAIGALGVARRRRRARSDGAPHRRAGERRGGLRRARRPSRRADLRRRPRRADPDLADDPRPVRRRAARADRLRRSRRRTASGRSTVPQRLFQVSGPGLAGDFPPPRTTEAPRNNLNLEVTSFIGREREIDQATQILERSSLLTLTGPGGVGKTRIGLRLARTLLDQFEDGAWIVECGSLTDTEFVLPSVDQRPRAARAGRTVAPGLGRRPPARQAAAPRPRRLRPGARRVRRAGRGPRPVLPRRAHRGHQP